MLSKVVEVRNLSAQLKAQLYGLYESCYDGASRERFNEDFNDKQWVILIIEREGKKIVGFSTQKVFQSEVDGKPVRVLFSGDTIILPEYWGTQALAK